MQSILSIWSLLFWFTWILFFLNTTNLIKLFVSSELVWIIMYVFSLITGALNDDIILYTLSLLIITIASVEFSIGFIIIIFYKKIFKKTTISENVGSDWSTVKKLNKY